VVQPPSFTEATEAPIAILAACAPAPEGSPLDWSAVPPAPSVDIDLFLRHQQFLI